MGFTLDPLVHSNLGMFTGSWWRCIIYSLELLSEDLPLRHCIHQVATSRPQNEMNGPLSAPSLSNKAIINICRVLYNLKSPFIMCIISKLAPHGDALR